MNIADRTALYIIATPLLVLTVCFGAAVHHYTLQRVVVKGSAPY